jgi:hypothetical protein
MKHVKAPNRNKVEIGMNRPENICPPAPDSGAWRLPSGRDLAEFALQAGFLAPLLLDPDRTCVHLPSNAQNPQRGRAAWSLGAQSSF